MDTDALLSAVYESPDDDVPRAVYGDWLMQRGDPRGELIGLQIAPGRAKPGQRLREKKLLELHAKSWVKPLGIEAKYVKFERGFPAVVDLDWGPHPKFNFDPAWSTIHTCSVPPHDDRCHATSLRVITRATLDDILVLATLRDPLAVTELRWGKPYRGPSVTPYMQTTTREAIAAFTAIAVLPRLRRLDLVPATVGNVLDPSALSWAWTAPWSSELAELVIPTRPSALPLWIPAFDASRLTRVELAMPNDEFPLDWRLGMIVTLERRGERFSELTAVIHRGTRHALEELREAIVALPSGTLRNVRVAIRTKAEFEAQTESRNKFAETCSRCGIAATIVKASA